MKNSDTPVWNKPFSHIYVEEQAYHYPRTERILRAFSEAAVIPCRNYKDIFCRGHQNPQLQRQSSALILAVAQPPYCYPGAPVCQSFGEEHFYYTSNVMNCIYDCEYCYLQGMYASGHVVVFVNPEDTFAEVEQRLLEHPMYICISYDTDLFALERQLGFLKDWCAFAKLHPQLTLEIRTKCASLSTLSALPVLPNVILALTLSPEYIAARYEHRTPGLDARLRLGKRALEEGRPLRLCFDPLLCVPDYREHYRTLFSKTFGTLSGDAIRDVSVGVFRISKDYLKNMRKARPCAITYYPYELTDGVYHYGPARSKEMLDFAKEELLHYLPSEKIFVWEDFS